MSATNHTTTIGLSQYISTDKPTYLTDYNGDMLAIDNAIASDRADIGAAQNKADTADGKADANKTSIDTLNIQINGDPEATPPTTGLAGDVSDLETDVNTIQSLIGTGHPTTSNQTIIGAVNGLEGAIAPREDADNLANSYSVGEQFARGGSVYKALVSLTADTPFASLVVNTDYEVSDPLTKQIEDAKPVYPENALVYVGTHSVSASPDGVKTWAELMADAMSQYSAYITALTHKYHKVIAASAAGYSGAIEGATAIASTVRSQIRAFYVTASSTGMSIMFAEYSATSSNCKYQMGKVDSNGDYTNTDFDSIVPVVGSSDVIITFELYEPLV